MSASQLVVTLPLSPAQAPPGRPLVGAAARVFCGGPREPLLVVGGRGLHHRKIGGPVAAAPAGRDVARANVDARGAAASTHALHRGRGGALSTTGARTAQTHVLMNSWDAAQTLLLLYLMRSPLFHVLTRPAIARVRPSARACGAREARAGRDDMLRAQVVSRVQSVPVLGMMATYFATNVDYYQRIYNYVGGSR